MQDPFEKRAVIHFSVPTISGFYVLPSAMTV